MVEFEFIGDYLFIEKEDSITRFKIGDIITIERNEYNKEIYIISNTKNSSYRMPVDKDREEIYKGIKKGWRDYFKVNANSNECKVKETK